MKSQLSIGTKIGDIE